MDMGMGMAMRAESFTQMISNQYRIQIAQEIGWRNNWAYIEGINIANTSMK